MLNKLTNIYIYIFSPIYKCFKSDVMFNFSYLLNKRSHRIHVCKHKYSYWIHNCIKMSGAHREAIQKQIHQDWANREYIEVITASIKRITDFLNSFGE